MKKLSLIILSILLFFISNSQTQFVSGLSWKRGDSTLVGPVEYYAKKDISIANAIPKENQYWTTSRIIIAPSSSVEYVTKASYDSVVTEYVIYKSYTAKQIEELNRVIDSLKTEIEQPEPPIEAPSFKTIETYFTISTPSNVSSGLYKDGKLIKTLFNNKWLDTGYYKYNYNLLDDKNRLISDLTGYETRTVSNNMQAKWEGVIGNTSTAKFGPTKHRGFKQPWALAIAGNTLFYSQLYGEGINIQNYVSLDSLQQKNTIFPGEKSAVNQQSVQVITDGVNVYWLGYDPFSYRYNTGSLGLGYWNFIFATKVNEPNTEVIFDNGTPYKAALGRTYKSVIDTLNNKDGKITGGAVQTKGNLLFVAHGLLNIINVYDKTTGQLLRTTEIESPGSMSLSTDEKYLWVITGGVVKKIDAFVGFDELTLSGTIEPKSISVNENYILIADAGTSQQVKKYTLDGQLIDVLGDYGGYYVNPSASKTKFYFTDKRNEEYPVQVYWQSDGSFWLIDGGNYRVLHFDSNMLYKDEFGYIPKTYNTWVDPNDPTRVFANFLEYKVGYTKELKDDWELAANWGANVLPNEDDPKSTIRPITFTNGRRYSFLKNVPNQTYNLVELTDTGLIKTGFGGIGNSTQLARDLSLYTMPIGRYGSKQLFTKRKLIEGDNPTWGESEVIAKIDFTDSFDAGYVGQPFTLRTGEITDNGNIVVWDGTANGSHYHLGGIKLGDSSFSFLSAKPTTKEYIGNFPKNGQYDIGNNVEYAGAVALAIDSFIVWGYHGEFWKNSQTNIWNFLTQDGLVLFQFGVVGVGLVAPAEMMAGNVFSGSIVKVNEKFYLYHNDEGHHGGVHRWEITGMESVKVQHTKPYLKNIPIGEDIRMTDSIPYNVVLNDSIANWRREPKTENYTDRLRNWWSVSTNRKSSDGNDIYIKYNSNITNSSQVWYPLDNFTSYEWGLSGELNYEGNTPTILGSNSFEILDSADNVLFRMQPKLSGQYTQFLVNNEVLRSDLTVDSKKIMSDYQPLKIELRDGSFYVSFSGVTKTVTPISGDIANPRKIRFIFNMTAGPVSQNSAVSIRKFIFKK